MMRKKKLSKSEQRVYDALLGVSDNKAIKQSAINSRTGGRRKRKLGMGLVNYGLGGLVAKGLVEEVVGYEHGGTITFKGNTNRYQGRAYRVKK